MGVYNIGQHKLVSISVEMDKFEQWFFLGGYWVENNFQLMIVMVMVLS